MMYGWMFEAQPSSLWRPLGLLGGSLLTLAAAIFVFPDLLAYLIAAFLAILGGSVLGAAYALRKAERQTRGRKIPVRTDSPSWSWH